MTEEEQAEQVTRIKTYVAIVNTTVSDNEELLGFVISETLDRVKLYLNREDVPQLVERPIAKVVGSIFNKYKNTASDSDVEHEVSSVSDNGQSVSYSQKVKSYLTTASDDELFTGVETLLRRYRRLNFNATT